MGERAKKVERYNGEKNLEIEMEEKKRKKEKIKRQRTII